MPWDRKRLLGYVETIQLILGVTDKSNYHTFLYAFDSITRVEHFSF